MNSLVFPVLTALAMGLLLWAIRLYATPGVGAILAEQARVAPPPKKPFFERIILPLVRRFVPTYDFAMPFTDRRKIRQRLASAGDPYGLTMRDVVQLKVASLLLSIPGALYFGRTYHLGWNSIIIMTLAAMIPLFFLPDIVLGEMAEKRQEEITTSLPDFMDLLAISITAGVGFDLALNNVVERMKGALADELERMMRELRLGNPRRLAYRKMIWRNDSQQLRSFFSAMMQADELGTPVADILEWQAQTMRHRRIQEARRKGAKASTKISLVLATLLLFALTGVIIATIGLNIFYGNNVLFSSH
ncbi:MAG: type II secretion system F family protein [Herpetosiphonaceae bacterium]|nr:type II secretion system F family protein [Herpetosiphonaceae bacterium]